MRESQISETKFGTHEIAGECAIHRVLIIGTGGIGRRHLKGYEQTRRATLSVVEPDAEKRAFVLSQFALVHSYADVSEVVLQDYDLAVICAPAHMHVPLMNACVSAGLPFMVEKPLSVTADGVRKTLDNVSSTNLLARVGFTRRVADELKQVRKDIQTGKIGELKLIYMNSSQEFPKYRPDFQTTYYARPEMGGGAILDAASHLFDMLIWIAGKPRHVSCMYDRLVLEGTQTEDTCLINIRFESGTMANVTINQFQKPNTNQQEFIGTTGNLLLDHSTLTYRNSDTAGPVETHDFMDGLVPMEAHQARFAMQANYMMDALEGGQCHLATLEDAYLNLRLALAAKQSWDERKIIELEH
ncbi:Gfo/Idh/MocA family protein [Maritalea sp.]|uniref:Gfo/Idh/MocA family protein n=1 Tax=Maritalea sp. TaxID=2003361 RepID=UPI003EF44BEA